VKIAKNTSGYDTKALRKIIVMAHAHIRTAEGAAAPRWVDLQVFIRGRDERSHLSGCAYLGGSKMWMTIPRPTVSARRVLWLAYHELMHVFGYEHAKYRDLNDKELAELIPDDYPIPKPEKKAKVDPREARIASLIERRAKWKTRLTRAQNTLKKINRRIRYYERTQPGVLAAMSTKGSKNGRHE
jgi:hypothetical protein